MELTGRIVVAAIALVFLTAASNAKKIPDFLTVCRRSNPTYDDCVKNSIMASRPHLGKGISRLHVPPADPLQIPQLIVDRDVDNLKVHAKLTDLRVYGIPSFEVESLKTDLPRLEMTATVMVPKVYVECEFDVDGRLLVVPLRGFGGFKGNFTNSRGTVSGRAEIVTNKKGVKHLKVKTMRINLNAGDNPTFAFENRDQRNAAIANTATNFILQNRRQVIEIVLPIAEETMAEVARQYADDILSTIPYSEILPD